MLRRPFFARVGFDACAREASLCGAESPVGRAPMRNLAPDYDIARHAAGFYISGGKLAYCSGASDPLGSAGASGSLEVPLRMFRSAGVNCFL
jgi:hypothetical protein